MNLASWIVLAVVIAILALAVKATFFKKEPKGGCCDVGDNPAASSSGAGQRCDASTCRTLAERGTCGSCAACEGPATKRNTLHVTYKPAE